MSLRDAAQQALEVIGWLRLHLQRDHQCLHMDSTGSGIPAWIAKSQTAICAALAEPQPEIEQLKAERDAAVKALREYAHHKPSCSVGYMDDYDDDCDCGLNAALDAARGES